MSPPVLALPMRGAEPLGAPVIACASLPGAGGCEAAAAALGVALATGRDDASVAGGDGAAVLAVIGGPGRRGPTMLAAEGARELEGLLRDRGLEAAARGRLAWVALADGAEWRERAAACAEVAWTQAVPLLLVLPASHWHAALADCDLAISGALLLADLPEHRPLCALAVREALACGVVVRVLSRAPGRVAARRALAGVEPGGDTGRRVARIARPFTRSARRRGRPAVAESSR